MPDDFGYCTVQDVARILGEPFPIQGTDPSAGAIAAAIRGQGDWLRRATRRHFYDPEYDSTGDDGMVDLPTTPQTVTDQAYDIPSSPHAGHTQLATNEQVRYPRHHRGTYARVQLTHRRVTTIDTLRVRSRQAYDDWTAASDRSEGRTNDYYISTDDQTGRSKLFVDSRSITPLPDYNEAVVADYSYGLDRIPDSIGRAVAFKAASELVLDKDSTITIPDSQGPVDIQTASEQFDKQANKLLKPYRATAVA